MSLERYEENESRRLVEGVLASWQPAKLQVDRDRLMFLAGRASAAGENAGAGLRLRAWPAATVVFAAASLLLAIWLVNQPERPATVVIREAAIPSAAVLHEELSPEVPAVAISPDEHVVTGPTLAASAAVSRGEVPPVNYIHTRDVALRMGVDALGSATGPGNTTPAQSYFQLMQGVAPAGMSRGAHPISKSLHSM